jgi:hypothetical protein
MLGRIASLALSVCVLAFSIEARADALSDSINAAYQRKDYATLIGILTPMANGGEPQLGLPI